MSIFHAVILGLIQGLTEFLPISSSGHLAVLPKVFGWAEQSLVFDTTLHLATALTLIVVFYKRMLLIIKSLISDLSINRFNLSRYTFDSRFGIYILIGCIPAAVLGFLFDNLFETIFRETFYIIIFICLGTLLMILVELLYKKRTNTVTSINRGKSFIIGIFQALALFPGISRSGATISGGMLLGFSREQAAEFSFLLSVPIVIMAGFFKIFSTQWIDVGISLLSLIVGFMVSFISGIFAVKFLLNFLKNNSLIPFIVYRIIFAVFLILILL